MKGLTRHLRKTEEELAQMLVPDMAKLMGCKVTTSAIYKRLDRGMSRYDAVYKPHRDQSTELSRRCKETGTKRSTARNRMARGKTGDAVFDNVKRSGGL